MSVKRLNWAGRGDINAFFGLMLDNIADLVLAVGLLHQVFEYPTDFALQNLVPGTAMGVMVGDLLFFFMALALMRSRGRHDVTAMPLGLDTPSTFGMVFFVVGPAFLEKKLELGILGQANADAGQIAQAARYAWHIGICSIVISGVFKFACALGANWVRRLVPRAGLLGSLAAVALVLISFLPLLEILQFPLAGLAALGVILAALVARVRLPLKMPGALAGLLVGAFIFYLTPVIEGWMGISLPTRPSESWQIQVLPTGWLSAFQFGWIQQLPAAVKYLPIVIPFALATVIGGIDCTESAAAAGDEFDANRVIGVEAFATLVAGLCGGVIQTTPYIGHPAYKAMGGRAGYTLATAFFVGGAGLLGYFSYLYQIIPEAAVFPILIFIGLEITAQSFRVTPSRHYPAVAIACVPALAALVIIFTDSLQAEQAKHVAELNRRVQQLEQLADQQQSAARAVLGDLPAGDDESTLGRLRQLLEQQQQAARQAIGQLRQSGEKLEQVSGNPAKGLIGEPIGDWRLAKNLQTIRILNGGFIITSLLWASILAAMIDQQFRRVAINLAVAALFSLLGVIHSPMPGSPLVNPFRLPDNLPAASAGQTPIYLCLAYLLVMFLVLVIAAWHKAHRLNNEAQPS